MDRSMLDYDRDPQFRAMVDMLTKMLMDMQTTPAELRQAVMLAAWKAEMYRGPNALVSPDGSRYEYVGPSPFPAPDGKASQHTHPLVDLLERGDNQQGGAS